jgi:cysteinyl-tRNA synthetase
MTLNAIQEELKKPLNSAPSLPSPSKGEGLPRGVTKSTQRGEGGGLAVIDNIRTAIESFQGKFEGAMDDDFNTAEALGYFYDLQTHLNSLLSFSKGKPTDEVASILKKGLDHFSKIGWVFGLFREDPEDYLARQKKEGLKKLNLTEDQVLQSIEERNLARKEKNWKRADEIRSDLLSKGIVLEDAPTGTIWKIK